MDINVHIEFNSEKLDHILALLGKLQTGVKTMSNELDSLTVQVASNTSAEQSAVLLLGQLHDLLVSAQSDPARLAALIEQLSTSKESLAAAIIANTV